MSVFKSDAIPEETSRKMLNSVQHGGHLHVNVCTVKFGAATAADDEIQLMRLPAGAKLVPHLCYAGAPAAQSNVDVELKGFTSATAFAAKVTFTPSKADAGLLTEETIVTAKLSGTGSIAKDTEVSFGIVYASLT